MLKHTWGLLRVFAWEERSALISHSNATPVPTAAPRRGFWGVRGGGGGLGEGKKSRRGKRRKRKKGQKGLKEGEGREKKKRKIKAKRRKKRAINQSAWAGGAELTSWLHPAALWDGGGCLHCWGGCGAPGPPVWVFLQSCSISWMAMVRTEGSKTTGSHCRHCAVGGGTDMGMGFVVVT